jgi:5-formyltetrahydrofolate cyclo-ligase
MQHMPAPVSHTELRNAMRAQRRSLDDRTQRQHGIALARQLNQQNIIRNAGRIACYLANDGEIETDELIEATWQRRQSVYLPILSPLQNSLYFAPFDADSQLVCNRYGIAEPVHSATHWLRAPQLDVVLLPLVAFDDAGNRLGMGGGFYDRTLAFLQHREHRRKPVLIGLAHELQRVETLAAQNWDIPLDAIATERRFMVF